MAEPALATQPIQLQFTCHGCRKSFNSSKALSGHLGGRPSCRAAQLQWQRAVGGAAQAISTPRWDAEQASKQAEQASKQAASKQASRLPLAAAGGGGGDAPAADAAAEVALLEEAPPPVQQQHYHVQMPVIEQRPGLEPAVLAALQGDVGRLTGALAGLQGRVQPVEGVPVQIELLRSRVDQLAADLREKGPKQAQQTDVVCNSVWCAFQRLPWWAQVLLAAAALYVIYQALMALSKSETKVADATKATAGALIAKRVLGK